jgi:hypothetical protein
MHAALPPHLLGVPPPPQVCGGVQVPHWSTPPQPSPAGPHSTACCAQVRGVQAGPESGTSMTVPPSVTPMGPGPSEPESTTGSTKVDSLGEGSDPPQATIKAMDALMTMAGKERIETSRKWSPRSTSGPLTHKHQHAGHLRFPAPQERTPPATDSALAEPVRMQPPPNHRGSADPPVSIHPPPRTCPKARTRGKTLAMSPASGVVRVPVSIGELFDKIAILRIKEARIRSEAKRANVRRELEALEAEARALALPPWIEEEERELREVNETLWDVEEDLRALEAQQDFGARFVELARAVYTTNDRRAAIKARINDRAGSTYREEKSYDEASR